MSIPTNLLRYAGIWVVSNRYSQYDFVESPIDGKCYIYVGVPDIVGGGDPSIANPLWVLLPQTSGVGPTGPTGPSGPSGVITSLNGVSAPAMDIVSPDQSIKVAPNLPNEVLLSRWGFIPYGSFSSTQIQSITAGVPLALLYDTKDIPSTTGINVLLPDSKIQVDDSGVYKILTSIEADSIAGNQSIVFYPAINGTPVDNSATQIVVPNVEVVVMTCEWFLALNGGDSVEIYMFDAVSSNTRAYAVPAVVGPPAIPAVPSVITSILRIA